MGNKKLEKITVTWDSGATSKSIAATGNATTDTVNLAHWKLEAVHINTLGAAGHNEDPMEVLPGHCDPDGNYVSDGYLPVALNSIAAPVADNAEKDTWAEVTFTSTVHINVTNFPALKFVASNLGGDQAVTVAINLWVSRR